MDTSQAQQIEHLLNAFDRLGVGRQVGFERMHLYSIITHSTAIEGSTITLEENTVMFDDSVVPTGRQVHEQMMNLDLKRAYEVASELAKARTPITLQVLKALSSVVMRNTGSFYHTLAGDYDEAKGDLRLQNVSVGRGGRSYLAWEKVEQRTIDFLQWLNERLSTVNRLAAAEIYDLSFEAHYRLVTIHPWSDGNGRMARLMMNLVQLEGEVVPSYVRSENKAAYIAALERSRNSGSSAPFLDFMAEETIDVLSQEIEEYRQDISRDVPWASEHNPASRETVNETVNETVTPRAKRIIAALQNNPCLTYSELAALLDISRSTLARDIATLRNAGFISREGADKNGKWLVLHSES